jgi:hypothetical protein
LKKKSKFFQVTNVAFDNSFLSMSMTLRSNLANDQTSTWSGPSHHSFIDWARITQMHPYFLSMGSTSYAKIFIFTSTLLFSKPKRKKKRLKKDTQTTNQEINIKFVINKWKLKFKISNIISMSQMRMNIKEMIRCIEVKKFSTKSSRDDGHSALSKSQRNYRR